MGPGGSDGLSAPGQGPSWEPRLSSTSTPLGPEVASQLATCLLAPCLCHQESPILAAHPLSPPGRELCPHTFPSQSDPMRLPGPCAGPHPPLCHLPGPPQPQPQSQLTGPQARSFRRAGRGAWPMSLLGTGHLSGFRLRGSAFCHLVICLATHPRWALLDKPFVTLQAPLRLEGLHLLAKFRGSLAPALGPASLWLPWR